MALLCVHDIPVGYDDNNNNGQQYLGDTRWGKNWCLLIKPDNLALTNLYGNNTDEANWYNDSTSGIRVRPGYKLEAWRDPGAASEKREWDGGEGGNNIKISDFEDTISSVRLSKDCGKNVWTWDDSCAPYNTARRAATCGSNLGAHPRCREFCNNNLGSCSAAVNSHCTGLGIDALMGDDICRDVRIGIRNNKCSTQSGLFATGPCQNYCTSNPNECLASMEAYCINNFDQSCKTFCEKNPKKSKTAIEKYCFANNGANIKPDSWCANMLIHSELQGEYTNQMNTFCNVNKNIPGSGAGIQKDLSNMKLSRTPGKTAEDLDKTLENPICACFDKELVKTKYLNVTNSDTYTTFVSYPECFLYDCVNGPKAYKKTKPPCDITMCTIDIQNLGITNSKDIKIENNCGKKADTPAAPGTPGTPGAAGAAGSSGASGAAGTAGAAGAAGTAGTAGAAGTPVVGATIVEKYNNFDNNYKLGLICLLIFIFIIIIYMWSKEPVNPYMQPMQPMPYNPYNPYGR